jgi:hypothetical protein
MFADRFEELEENIEGLYYAVVNTELNGVVSEEWSEIPDSLKMFLVID